MQSMLNYHWKHTWASQFSSDDSRLLVAGVVSTYAGEVAIFKTDRTSNDVKKSKFSFLCRIVNDPYDIRGCWLTGNDHFLSGTVQRDFHGNIDASIWLCKPKNGGNEGPTTAVNLSALRKTLFKYRYEDNVSRLYQF